MSARNVDTIYKLSPLQEGILFHSILEPEADVYVVQFSARIRGPLDVDALRQSWQRVVVRHGMLRTSFHWKEVEKPVQVVHRDVELPWNTLDWRGGDVSEPRIASFIEEDLRRGFALDRAPLIRLTLIRLEDELHQFVVTQHHLILDGWSLHVMLREVFATFRSLREGRPVALPPARPFGDYLSWLRRQSGALAEARSYWSDLLSGVEAATPVPLGRDEAAPTGDATEWWDLGPGLTGEIQQLARARELTVNTVVQGAWALALGRLTGEDDVVYGSVVAGRPPEIAGIDSMVGMFINTLPVRVTLPAGARAGDWLRELQGQLTAMRRFEFTPLIDVQNCSAVPRGTPLFHAVVAFENYPMESSLASAVRGLEIFDTHVSERSNYPITFSVVPGPSVRFKLAYDTGRLQRNAVVRILGAVEQILHELVARPDAALGEISLLDGATRDRVLRAWNDSDRQYDGPSSIHRLFEEQAARTPDRTAIIFGDREIGFAELNARANRLAHHLRGLGIGAESIVGVSLDRGIDAVVALLAILKCGAAYLPLDPAYPRERLDFMCEDARVAFVITDSAHAEAVPAFAKSVVLDRDWPLIAREPERDLRADVGGDGAAYVIYTSGSTGRPKGIVGLHGGAVNRFRWMWERYPFASGEVHAQKTSLNFLDSLWEIFGPLLQGVPIAVFDNDTVKDPRRLAAEMERTGVTRLVLVPSLLRVLLESDARLPDLKICVTSGEELPLALARRFRERMPHCLLLNLYGSSEISADATYEEVRGDEEAIPIGRPLANMRAYVLDRAMQPVPPGVTGELYIGGVGLARGYLHRPELTAERFVPDPFDAGARLFRTGDLAAWREDGRLDYLGRSDHQVKIRGFRVELGEIESVLREHADVASAVVVARDGALVAYVTLSSRAQSSDLPPAHDTSRALREHLRGRLPEYMLPAHIVPLESLPLTPSGKIDRRALPAPERPSSLQFVAPRTDTEERVAAIFCSVLGLPRIGVEDHFFEAGGHSLMATQVTSRVRDRFGIDLPVRVLFQAPTVARFAAAVDERLSLGAESAAAGADEAALSDERPLSFAQQRLWFLDQMAPGDPLYNVPIALRIGGALDAAALERALTEIVRRHEVLRTRLVAVDGRPATRLEEAAPLSIPIVDAAEEDLDRLAREEVLRRFDLARDTLIRARLLRVAADDHLLIVTMHHIASDGWSLGILVRELSHLYEAFARGEAASLPPLTFQYADYARRQREWLRGERLDAQLAFWKERLDGIPPLLELPYDRPRPAVQTFRGATENFSIAAETMAPLLDLAHRHDATPFMVLLAALQTLLHRYSNQTRLSVGTPIAGRTWTEVEPLIGFFVNTLVLPADFGGDPEFLQHLDRVRDTALDAYAHQELPFEKLVEEMRLPRDLSRHPLFQVLFVLQNEDVAADPPAGLRFRPLQIDAGLARFDLLVQIVPREGAWQGSIEYSTDLFDRSTVARMIAHFQTLLASIAADPRARVSRLNLLPESERRRIAVEFNATFREYGGPHLLHRLVEEQVVRTPDAVAVTCGEASLTYAELNARADRLAARLVRDGVGPDVLVAVSMERSLDLVASLLAVHKAGGAYVPIDPDYPQERIRFMLADSGAKIVLDRIDWDALAHEAGHDAEQPGPDHLAYVIYTSGSTGTPKGAMNHHRGIVNRLRWMQETFALGPGDVVAQKTPFSFDVSVWEFFWPLITGARLAVAPPGIHRDSSALARWMARENVTVIHFVPPMLQTFLQHAAPNDALRLVICSGEALPKSLQDDFHARSRAALHNLYGPTEAAVDVTHWPCAPDDARPVVPIGKPIANTRISIVDRHGQPVPIGVPGELLIGGVQVGRGYLNRTALTAEKFNPDPMEPGARLYRTGDLARWLSDGAIEFLGRLDHQIKLRGFRIELGEIESVLREHESVRDAVVLARNDALVAYVTGEGANDALREHLRARLPEHMVPAHIVRLDAFPLSPNGKIDRRALPDPGADALARAADRVAPRTDAERALAAIWSELLRVDPGAHDDFFALGGHSLLATRLVARVRDAFGVELPLRQVFAARTLEAMAAAIGSSPRVDAPIVAVERGADLSLSFIQERLWFLDQFDPGTPSLNIPLAVRIRGAIDEARLEAALEALVERHESLRTNFRAVDGTPRAVVVPRRPVVIERVDAPPAEDSFDLAGGPLLRVRLQRISDHERLLYFTVHHIVADGWSLVTMLDDLDQLYRGASLPPLRIQYADFAAWQRERTHGELLERQLEYWKGTLAGAPPLLDLPLDRPRPPVQTYRGARLTSALDAAPVARVARESGATTFMVLLAAFEVVLARWSGQEDLVVGAPVANRPSRELERVVGPFLNSVALRTSVEGNPAFRELVERVRDAAVGAFQHADVPFEKVLEAVQPERDLSRTPVFQVFFNMLNFPLAQARLGEARLEIESVADPLSKFDLTVYVAEDDGALRVDLVYNADLFDEERMRELLRQFERVVDACAADPARRILDVSLVTDSARAVLPNPSAPLDDTWPGAVHELFAENARRHPDRIAVTDRERTLTYGQLDEESERFADHIRRIASPVVALLGRRNASLVVNVIGALKAGAAISILDPAHPRARNAQILRVLAAPNVARASARDAGDVGRASARPCDPDAIACITFTSGSTGIPKAVAGRHRSLTHFTPWQCDQFGLHAGDRFTMLSGIAHDPLQRDIFTPLQIGATICIPDPDRMGEPGYLLEWAARERVTVAHLTPAMIQMLADSERTLASLRVAFVVGDVLTRDDVRRLRGVAPNVRCINFYGSTETQRAVAWYPVTERDLDPSVRAKAALPLGRGMPDVQLVLRNVAGQLCGVGEVGEVYVRSPHLAAGYLNDPAGTAERFIGDAYRTGDLARYLPDGNAEWVARADRQVKVRGFRIELGEIEAALRTHPGVREAVVILREEGLVAYVVGETGALREHLRERLPESMIPAHFVAIDAIPLTPNRKIDRDALPAPEPVRGAGSHTPPRDVVEIELTRIWEDVLGLHPIGIDDDFFSLGGHSLLAVRLLARVERHFGRKLPLVTFFQRATIARLAAALRETPGPARRSPLVSIQPRGARRPFFCVHPVGGTVLCYRTLSARLGDGQPFFALESVGVDGERAPLRSIESMAGEYLRAVRAQQPRGPYVVGGWSFGGIVAFEMAQQLRREGEEVLPILLDTWTPGSLGDFEDAGDDATILRLLARALGDMAGRDFDLATDALRAAGGRDEQLAYVVDEAHRLGALPPDVGVAQLRPLFGVVEANLEARRCYTPRPLDRRLVLFKATEALIDAPENESLGWDAFAPLDLHIVPGNHHTMLAPPNVDALVERLRPYLDEM